MKTPFTNITGGGGPQELGFPFRYVGSVPPAGVGVSTCQATSHNTPQGGEESLAAHHTLKNYFFPRVPQKGEKVGVTQETTRWMEKEVLGLREDPSPEVQGP